MHHRYCNILVCHELSMASRTALRLSLACVSARNDYAHCSILIIWSWLNSTVYITFLCTSGSHQVVCQHIVVSILTMHVMPVPPQLRTVLLLKPNLVKGVGHSCVHGHGGEKTRASIDGIQKDITGPLGILNATPWKTISKIFSPE